MKKSHIIIITILTISCLLLALPLTPVRNSLSGILSKYTVHLGEAFGIDLRSNIVRARKTTNSINYKINGLDSKKYENHAKNQHKVVEQDPSLNIQP